MSLPQEPGDPRFEIGVTGLGNVTMAFPHVSTPLGTDVRNEPLGGGGADLDRELAWVRAVVEGAERYCSIVHDDQDFVIATAEEIGGQALDFRRLPRCSATEYADPKCPLQPPDPKLPIRWVRGYSLVDRCERYVPAVMTHLYLSPLPGERFWHQISTGTAAHTTLSAALVSAICETIERDAIALTWLARLPLPQIELTGPVPDLIAASRRRLARSFVHQYFFDATTDLLVPTVFAVQVTENHPALNLFVSCATSLDPAVAYVKTIREAAPSRKVIAAARDLPSHVEDFDSLYHGATYYGRPGNRQDFDFLLRNSARRSFQEIKDRLLCDPDATDDQKLHFVIDRLRCLDMEAVAVDLTTEEVREAGLWVVRVIIPELVPMSPVARARYLATPRLYEYSRQLGLQLREDDVNPHPMPFA